MSIQAEKLYQLEAENGQAELVMARIDNGAIIAAHIAHRLSQVAYQITERTGDNPTLEMVLRELEPALYTAWSKYLADYMEG